MFRHTKYEFRHSTYKFRHSKIKVRSPKETSLISDLKFRHPRYKLRHPRHECTNPCWRKMSPDTTLQLYFRRNTGLARYRGGSIQPRLARLVAPA